MADTSVKLIATLLFFLLSNIPVQGQNKIYINDSTKKQSWTSWHFSLKYPDKAVENKIQGEVVVSFDIDSTCSIVNVKLIKGIGYGCDEEAIKCMKTSRRIYPSGQGRRCIPQQGLLQTFNFINPDIE